MNRHGSLVSSSLTTGWDSFAEINFNRSVLFSRGIVTEDEYDRTVAAVEHQMDKGQGHLSPEEAALA
jgi:hypothetical protein